MRPSMMMSDDSGPFGHDAVPGGFGPPLRPRAGAGAPARAEPRRPPSAQPEPLPGGAAEFARRVERLLSECRRWRLSLVVLRLRLDASGGGPQAESALADEMANRIRARLRANDAVVRIDDAEAGALLTGAGEESVGGIVLRLHHALSEPYAIGGQRVEAVVHIGRAVYPGHALSGESLVRIATPRA
jgi:hypothetical protein